MLKLRFIPIFEDNEFILAVKEYETIWSDNGPKILEQFSALTGLNFIEDRIAIVIYEWMSTSGDSISDVIKLRASYDKETKMATLVHELGHRFINQLKNRKDDIDEHRTLFLFLYDMWVELWGKDFADNQVKIESGRKGVYDYEGAWKWAMELSKEERVDLFKGIKGLN
jgi:hypothetical protein